jgi:hypothetical protein
MSRASPDFLRPNNAKADLHLWENLLTRGRIKLHLASQCYLGGWKIKYVHETHGHNKPISVGETFYGDVVSY